MFKKERLTQIMCRRMCVKKIVVLALIVMLSCSAVLDVQAANFYNFKLSSTTSAVNYKANGTIDYVTKNGGNNYENCFYLTPTYFNKKGSAKFRSMKKGDTSVVTSWLSVSYGGENVPRSKYYKKASAGNSKYKLQGKRGTIDSGTSITVSGRWTP